MIPREFVAGNYRVKLYELDPNIQASLIAVEIEWHWDGVGKHVLVPSKWRESKRYFADLEKAEQAFEETKRSMARDAARVAMGLVNK